MSKRGIEAYEERRSDANVQQIMSRCREALYNPSRSGKESERHCPLSISVSKLLVINETRVLRGLQKSCKERKIVFLAFGSVRCVRG
jgi:hypothetical protein